MLSRLRSACSMTRYASLHRVPRASISITCSAPSKSAAREAPTAVALFGLSRTSELRRALQTFNDVGFSLLDVADVGLHSSIDDAVERTHDAILRAGASLPPVAIAPAHMSVFVQKYLESWPVSAMISLVPLPPRPAVTVQRWLGVSNQADLTADALRAGMPRVLGQHTAAVSDSHSLSLLCAEGAHVNLEPSPVPWLVVSPKDLPEDPEGPGGPLVTAGDIRASLSFHEVEDEDEEAVMWVDTAAYGLDTRAAVGTLWANGWLQDESEPGSATRQGRADLAGHVADRLVKWVQARF